MTSSLCDNCTIECYYRGQLTKFEEQGVVTVVTDCEDYEPEDSNDEN